jgi:hypothetical protein
VVRLEPGEQITGRDALLQLDLEAIGEKEEPDLDVGGELLGRGRGVGLEARADARVHGAEELHDAGEVREGRRGADQGEHPPGVLVGGAEEALLDGEPSLLEGVRREERGAVEQQRGVGGGDGGLGAVGPHTPLYVPGLDSFPSGGVEIVPDVAWIRIEGGAGWSNLGVASGRAGAGRSNLGAASEKVPATRARMRTGRSNLGAASGGGGAGWSNLGAASEKVPATRARIRTDRARIGAVRDRAADRPGVASLRADPARDRRDPAADRPGVAAPRSNPARDRRDPAPDRPGVAPSRADPAPDAPDPATDRPGVAPSRADPAPDRRDPAPTPTT